MSRGNGLSSRGWSGNLMCRDWRGSLVCRRRTGARRRRARSRRARLRRGTSTQEVSESADSSEGVASVLALGNELVEHVDHGLVDVVVAVDVPVEVHHDDGKTGMSDLLLNILEAVRDRDDVLVVQVIRAAASGVFLDSASSRVSSGTVVVAVSRIIAAVEAGVRRHGIISSVGQRGDRVIVEVIEGRNESGDVRNEVVKIGDGLGLGF